MCTVETTENSHVGTLHIGNRAYRFLLKNQINSIEELIQYTPEDLKNLQGCGAKSLKEIENALTLRGYSLSSFSTAVDHRAHDKETPVGVLSLPEHLLGKLISNEIFSIEHIIFLGKKLQSVKGLGRQKAQLILYEAKKFFLYYSYEFPLNLVQLLFLGMNELEIDLLSSRLGYIAGEKLTLGHLGKKHNLTHERIRQKEVQLTEKIGYFFQSYQQCNKEIHILLDDLGLYGSGIKEVQTIASITSDFFYDFYETVLESVCYIYRLPSMGSYFYIKRNNNDYIIDEFQKLFQYLQGKSTATMKIKYQENLCSLFPHITSNAHHASLMHLIIKEEYGFTIDSFHNITITANRRDYETTILHIMMEYAHTMHYSEVYNLLVELQPQFTRKEQTVLHHLASSDNYTNVGQGTYKLKTDTEPQGNITELAEKYLQKHTKARLNDLMAFIMTYRIVKQSSIYAMLFNTGCNKFVKLKGHYVTLDKNKHLFLDDIVDNRKYKSSW